MSWYLGKLPLGVEPLAGFAETIEHYGYEGECLTGLPAIAQGLRQQARAQTLPLRAFVNPKPSQDGRRQGPFRKPGRDAGRQIGEVDMGAGKGVIASDSFRWLEQHLSCREPFFLVLQRLRREPCINARLAATKITASVFAGEPYQPMISRKLNQSHLSPRMIAPNRFWAAVGAAG